MAAGKKRKKAAVGSGGVESGEPASKRGSGMPAGGAGAPEAAALAKVASVFKAPEAAEVLEIARTRNLYKSNLFRLQLDELLRELAPRKSNAKLEAFLHSLRPLLLGLSGRELPADLAAEFPHLCFQQRHPFPMTFAAPKRIDLVGSYLLGTCMRSNLQADVALEMPAETFQSKDYLNFRYSDKRAAYIGEVYRQLSKQQASGPLAGVELLFESLHGDPYRPCLVLRPAEQDAAKEGGGPWIVRLLPTCPADLFPAAKLAPDRNLVRPTDATKEVAPTAHYNSCILEDTRMRVHLEFLHKALQRFTSLRDAILLLKRWAWTRSFLSKQPARRAAGAVVFTPLSGFCLSTLAAHSAQVASVAPAETSSFQLFKLALSTLANTDWEAQKLVLGKAAPCALSAEERSLCGAHFYDTDGMLNFFWRLGPFVVEMSREAQRALKVLDAEADPYDAVFGQRASPELLWDCVVRAPPLGPDAATPALGSGALAATRDAVSPREPADTPQALALAARLSAVLQAGLGDRCAQVSVRLVGEPCQRWKHERPPGVSTVMAGVVLEPTNLDRALDRGPSAEDAEAAARFRSLWGPEKSELRRFKDGSILECVVWAKPPADRAVDTKKSPAVATQILRHLLDRHFGEISPGTEVLAGPMGFVPNLGERGRRMWTAFEAFKTHFCQLSSMPIAIKDVHPVDDAFSYTDITLEEAPPTEDGISRTLLRTVVEFEASGRWPREPEACRKVAGALLVQAREELLLDLGVEADVTEDFLDVRYPEVVFRVQVFHPHELTDAAQRVTSFQVPAGAALPAASAVERLRKLWWQPRIRNALHAHALRQPALAGAARLCKRWMASQMLSGYDDFVEHLVAYAFLHPAPFDSPSSPQVGFCRFCSLLAGHDWQHEPLIIDFDGKFSDEERLSLRQSFERGRTESERTTHFWVSSRFDPHAILIAGPPVTVCTWLQRRAQHALGFYSRKLLGDAPPSAKGWQPLFALDTAVFDLVFRLLPQGVQDDGSKKSKLARRKAHAARPALLGLVAKLRANLSSVCLVFYDLEGRMAAVKWRPGAFFPQHQNVLMGAVPHTMVSQKGQPLLCVPNVLYLTSAIASLAEGLAVDLTMVGP